MFVMLKYIGKRPSVRDTVAGTGLVWQAGETKAVPEREARLLLAHTDTWVENTEIMPMAEVVVPPPGFGQLKPLEAVTVPQVEIPEVGKRWEELPPMVVIPPNLPSWDATALRMWASNILGINLGAQLSQPELVARVLGEVVRYNAMAG
jgi:hypothetical protein